MTTRFFANHTNHQGGSRLKRSFRCTLGRYAVILLLGATSCRLFSTSPPPSPTLPLTEPPITTGVPVSGDSPASSDPALAQAMALLAEARADLDGLADVPRYDIQLTIQPDLHSFTGHALVTLTGAVSPALESLYFRLLPNGGASYGEGALVVTQVRLDGKPLEAIQSGDDSVLEVPLPQALRPGEQVALEFDFAGSVPVDFGGEATPGAYGIYNYSQGLLALSAWYPLLAVHDESGWHLDPASPIGDSVFSQTALYQVSIVAPEDVLVVATGVEVSQEAEGDWLRHDYVSGPVRDFFIVASPDLQRSTQDVGGTRVNSYYYPGDQTAGRVGLSVAAEALRRFNQHFGAYPFTEFDIVQAPMRNALGVEFPGIVLIGDTLYQDVENPSFAITIAHEVAHQWWYSVVGNDVFAEPWLDEALSTYTSGVYYQDAAGEEAYQGLVAYWGGRYEALLKDGLDEPVARDLAYFESLDAPRVYSTVAYTKGALFFKALRDAIGDEAFFAALQAYYQDHKYQVASAADLLETFEAASGGELDPLYQEWLFLEQ